ncbi:MAG: hypothetical protein ACKO9Q_23695, partial [Pirellula sp.]
IGKISRHFGKPHCQSGLSNYVFLWRFCNLEVLCLRDFDPENVRFDFPLMPSLVETFIDENRVKIYNASLR